MNINSINIILISLATPNRPSAFTTYDVGRTETRPTDLILNETQIFKITSDKMFEIQDSTVHSDLVDIVSRTGPSPTTRTKSGAYPTTTVVGTVENLSDEESKNFDVQYNLQTEFPRDVTKDGSYRNAAKSSHIIASITATDKMFEIQDSTVHSDLVDIVSRTGPSPTTRTKSGGVYPTTTVVGTVENLSDEESKNFDVQYNLQTEFPRDVTKDGSYRNAAKCSSHIIASITATARNAFSTVSYNWFDVTSLNSIGMRMIFNR